MLTLESLWRDAAPETKVCTICGTTKNMVLRAITEGAADFTSLAGKVDFCRDNECAKINPSKRGCYENAQALLDIYVPVFLIMTKDGSCGKSKKRRLKASIKTATATVALSAAVDRTR